MINRTNRAIASVLAFFLVISLVFAPALTASAEDMSASSAELAVTANGVDFTVKVAVDAEQGLAALASMGAEGETYMDLAVFAVMQGLILQSNTMLDQAYGTDMSKLAENFSNSIFAPNSGSSMALSQEEYDNIMNLLQSATSVPALSEQPSVPVNMDVVLGAVETIAKFAQERGQEAVNALMASTEMNMAPTTLTIRGEDVDVSLTKIKFGPEALGAFFKAISEEIANDTEMLEAVGALIQEMQAAGANVTINGAEAGDDAVSVLAQAFGEVGPQLEQAIVSSNISIEITMAADKTTGEPVCIGCGVTVDENEMGLYVVLHGNSYGVYVLQNGEYAGAYLILNDTDDGSFSATVSVEVNGQESGRLDLVLTNEGYALTITSDDQSVTAVGSISAIDNGICITLDSVDGQEFPGTIALMLRSEDAIAVPAYVEVLSLSEEEFMDVVQGAMGLVEALTSVFGG